MDPRRGARQLTRWALFFGLLLVACVAPSPEALDSARRGRDDALADVERRRPRLAYIGVDFAAASPLDPRTGLVRFSVGCCKSRERVAYRDAYNDAVDEARAAGRLEGTSLAAKATTREAVEARFAAARPQVVDGMRERAVTSPDGRFVISAAVTGTMMVENRGPYFFDLFVTESATGLREDVRFLGGSGARVLFEDDGTTLLVRDDAARVYETIDLPSGLLLQVFPDPEPAR